MLGSLQSRISSSICFRVHDLHICSGLRNSLTRPSSAILVENKGLTVKPTTWSNICISNLSTDTAKGRLKVDAKLPNQIEIEGRVLEECNYQSKGGLASFTLIHKDEKGISNEFFVKTKSPTLVRYILVRIKPGVKLCVKGKLVLRNKEGDLAIMALKIAFL